MYNYEYVKNYNCIIIHNIIIRRSVHQLILCFHTLPSIIYWYRLLIIILPTGMNVYSFKIIIRYTLDVAITHNRTQRYRNWDILWLDISIDYTIYMAWGIGRHLQRRFVELFARTKWRCTPKGPRNTKLIATRVALLLLLVDQWSAYDPRS